MSWPEGDDVPELRDTAVSMVAPGKGVPAADESIATTSKRLAAAGIPASETARRDCRELLLTAPELAQRVSGIIFCDQTLRQSLAGGPSFAQAARDRGIPAGIKVDTGVTELPFADGGTVTEGLDGLRGRLAEYRELGATFAKWRAVLVPDRLSLRAAAANAHALARYAALGREEVAGRTLRVLRAAAPAIVPGIAFLSGGQSNERACANLAAINAGAGDCAAPWRLTYSFGRALVSDALYTWGGDPGRVTQAQAALAANCARASAASYLVDPAAGVVRA
jgi:fructose-bisphosphate aldolase class 1